MKHLEILPLVLEMSLLALVFDAAPLKCFTMDPLKKGERVRGYCPVEKPLLSVQKVAA